MKHSFARHYALTSTFIDDKWIGEFLIGHPRRFITCFECQCIFNNLLQELLTSHELHGSSRTTQ